MCLSAWALLRNSPTCSDRDQSHGRGFQTQMGTPMYLLRERVLTWKRQPFLIKHWHWKGWIMIMNCFHSASLQWITFLWKHLIWNIFNLRARSCCRDQVSFVITAHPGTKQVWPLTSFTDHQNQLFWLDTCHLQSCHSHIYPPSEGNHWLRINTACRCCPSRVLRHFLQDTFISCS